MRSLLLSFVLLASFDAQAMAPINARHLIAQSDPFPNGCYVACAVCPACKGLVPQKKEPTHGKPAR